MERILCITRQPSLKMLEGAGQRSPLAAEGWVVRSQVARNPKRWPELWKTNSNPLSFCIFQCLDLCHAFLKAPFSLWVFLGTREEWWLSVRDSQSQLSAAIVLCFHFSSTVTFLLPPGNTSAVVCDMGSQSVSPWDLLPGTDRAHAQCLRVAQSFPLCHFFF